MFRVYSTGRAMARGSSSCSLWHNGLSQQTASNAGLLSHGRGCCARHRAELRHPSCITGVGVRTSHHSADERRRSAASAGPHAKHVAEHRGRKARDAVLRRSHEVHQLLVGVVSQLAALGRAAVHLILALTGRPGGHGRVPQLALQVVLGAENHQRSVLPLLTEVAQTLCLDNCQLSP